VPDSLAAIHAKLKERVTEMVEIEADLAAGKIKPPPGARWEELPASVAEEANLALMESELPEEPAAVAEVSQLRGVL